MSTFKLSLFENCVFINYAILPGETEQKLVISMLLPKHKKLHFCRNTNDTVGMFIERLSLKISSINKKKDRNIIISSHIFFKIDGNNVPSNTICSEIFTRNNSNITLEIDDNLFNVLIDAPIINKLKLGDPPYEGLMFYPIGFDRAYNVSIVDSKFLWYRIDHANVIEVGSKITYTPTRNDVGCQLKLVCNPCNKDGVFGPTAEIVSLPVKENVTKIYPFENRLKMKSNNSIRIVSYNILAAQYLKTEEAKTIMYPYCPVEVLQSNYRNPLILQELIAYEGDIICLQEVEQKFFIKELSPLLNHFMAMKGNFLKKNSREGLSIFYSEKFVLLEEFNIKLNNLDSMEIYCESILKHIINHEFWKSILEKQTALQCLLLKMISDEKKLFLICNTHLISTSDGDSIRLFQALIELIIINKIKEDIKNNYIDYNVSIIFCGDFNSTPDSYAYKLLTELSLPEEYNDAKTLDELKSILNDKMHSAYVDIQYTNYTQAFSGLLDYIFFNNEKFECIQTLKMPPHSDVIENGGLPSILFPSDHIALVADLKIK